MSKDLGVCVDSHLKFDKHMDMIVHTANTRAAALILKCFIVKNADILKKAFVPYVRPILEYCSPVWSPHHVGMINKIENVQRRFTKRIDNMSNLTYDDRLEILNFDSLYARRIKQDLVMCFCILHGFVDVSYDQFFSMCNTQKARGHTYKLFKSRCSLDVCKHTFANRVVDSWNKLGYLTKLLLPLVLTRLRNC